MFLVFEGIDGSGKSTQAALLARRLEDRGGRAVLLVREPGGTPLGEKLRDLVLDPERGDISPETEVFLFMAARSHLVRTRIAPALSEGKVVISDRFLWSSVVYQGFAAGIPPEIVLSMGDLALGGVRVSRTFIIDIDPAAAFARVRDRNRMEKRGLDFQVRVRDGFLELARRFPEAAVVIDGSGSAEDVHARVLSSLPAAVWP